MSSTLIPLALAAAMFPGLIFAPDVEHDKTTVPSFDLSSYLGTWYEPGTTTGSKREWTMSLRNIFCVMTERWM